jgi:hypothetical protein
VYYKCLDVESLLEIYITSFYSDFHQEKHYGFERLPPRYLKMKENQLRTICWRWIFHEHRPHGISAGWFSSAGDDASPRGRAMSRNDVQALFVYLYGKHLWIPEEFYYGAEVSVFSRLGHFFPMLGFFPKSSMTL